MKLAGFLGLELSSWEERLLAATYLCGKQAQVFSRYESASKCLNDALTRISCLPPEWGRELCLEALLEP